MAQSALTVTPPSPTPPTNMSCTGATGPNPPNFTRGTYADWLDNTKFDTLPPPYFDDGAAGAVGTFAANTAALASGTSAADNNTGTTPGTAAGGAGGTGFNSVSGTYPGATNGVVPASTSVPHEAAGTETSATGAGNISYAYPGGGTQDTSKMYGVGPALTAPTAANPVFGSINGAHASTLSPATNPALTSIATIASGGGTGTCSATGTNFTRQSVLVVNGVSYPTTFVSATNITATTAKRPTAGTWPVYVITGGVVTTLTVNWTFS
jgi:hypothetical protein